MTKGSVWLIGFLVCIIPSVALAWVYPVNKEVDGFRITQKRGDYLGCYNGYCYNSYHLGEDVNTANDEDFTEPVYVIGRGVVTFSENYPGWGYIIIVRHESLIGDICSLYGHLYGEYEDMYRVNDRVEEGEQIGIIENGSEGGITYPSHLHFEIRSCDRVTVLRPNGESRIIDLAEHPGYGYTNTGPSDSDNPTWDYFHNPSRFINERRNETAIEDTIDRAIYENRSDNFPYYFTGYYPSTLTVDEDWDEIYELRYLYFRMTNVITNTNYYVIIFHAYDKRRPDRRFTNFYDPIDEIWSGWIYWEDT